MPAPGHAGRDPSIPLGGGTSHNLGPTQLCVSPALYQKFQKLIYDEAGIWLGSSKTALLCGRLSRRLRALHIDSLEDYYQCVTQRDQQEERAQMIDAITTNETGFFRGPKQFDFLVQSVFQPWLQGAERGLRPKRVRIWSAGCSSGEEPYTLAMLLAKHLPAHDGWDTRLLATDISTRMLEKARKGIYDVTRSTEIPTDLLLSFMLRGFADRCGQMKVKIAIQQMVDFEYLNLNQEPCPVEGMFDVIFCRNVLIYFDGASRRRVVTNLVRHLAAGGFLFLGHAESLTNLSLPLRSLGPATYTTLNDANVADLTMLQGSEFSPGKANPFVVRAGR